MALALSLAAGSAPAQEATPRSGPAPAATPEPAWKGSIGAGLAVTTGNSDTNSYNASFAAAYDPKRKNALKAEGLYLRSSTTDQRTVDKASLGARDEYRLGEHAFVFGEVRYLRDVRKGIRSLVSPLGGVGVKVVQRERAQFSFDAAVGGQFEKDAGRAVTRDGAVQAGQRLAVKLSKTASIAQRSAALWKIGDFGDALYRFEVGLAASISRRVELKLAFLDDFKSRPADPLLKRNDSSVVAALVFKIG